MGNSISEDRKRVWYKYYRNRNTGTCFTCDKKIHKYRLEEWEQVHMIAIVGPVVDDTIIICCRKCRREMGTKHPFQYVREQGLKPQRLHILETHDILRNKMQSS